MTSSNAIVLCTYSYDPLDRLAAAAPAGSGSVQRFYQKSRLTTEIQGEIQRAVFQTEDHLLARQQLQSGQTGCALLGTDQQRSVLHSLDPAQQRAFAYSPYGFRPPQLDLPGFNGEQPDPVTGHYLLGNGYRAFNPVLMRFNSPDSLSPFGKGGLNAYAYCVGDPVNRVDPDGHTPALLKSALRFLKVMRPSHRASVERVTAVSMGSSNPGSLSNLNSIAGATPPVLPTSPSRLPLMPEAVKISPKSARKQLHKTNKLFDNVSDRADEFHRVDDAVWRFRVRNHSVPEGLSRMYEARKLRLQEAYNKLPPPPSYVAATELPPDYQTVKRIRRV